MIVLNLKAKVCMSHLLLKPTFDTFSLIEGEVTTFNRFQVDGRIHKDFFDEAFEKEYSTWGEVRDFFFQVIRGKKTPLNFKFILSLAKDLDESLEGKDVIVVEDIVDSGRTLYYLLDILRKRGPKSMKLCTLLDKPDRRVRDVHVDYVGFNIPDEFVVGFGLDYAQKYRNLPYIGIVEM